MECPYSLAVRARNFAYDRKLKKIYRLDAAVICVGNLTLGGTGKTPMVAWLASWFQGRGVGVAIVSRGFGSRDGRENDEALELRQRLPDVPHLQNPDRVAAARQAIAEHGAQVIILDDGFQHRRLARDLDIVLLDAAEPFGFDHVFPRGTLREPASGLQRAGIVALSKADTIDEVARIAIRDRAKLYASAADWIEIAHRTTSLLDASGNREPVSSQAGSRVAAFCGIGNPASFRRTLEHQHFEIAAWREFPDHFAYDAAAVESIAAWANNSGADFAICTQKDLVKLRRGTLGKKPLRALAIEIEFLAGKEILALRLENFATRFV